MTSDVSELMIPTPMTTELHAVLKQWAWCGFTGGAIVGNARIGKTEAVRQLSDFIPDRNGDPISICRVSYSQRDKNTIRSVFYRIARTIGRRVTRPMTADDILSDLLMYFSDIAISNHKRKVILMIDEAQELAIEQLFAFAELFNELEEISVHLIVIFVANKDRFSPLAKQLLKDENRFIRERFFNYIYVFHGIRSADELRTCLMYYDTTTVDPSDTRTWLQYYCPGTSSAGFRMIDIADTLWDLWCSDYANRFGYDSWGMTYFNRTISIILRDYFPQYWSKDPDVIRDILVKSLEAAGNEPTLMAVFSNAS